MVVTEAEAIIGMRNSDCGADGTVGNVWRLISSFAHGSNRAEAYPTQTGEPTCGSGSVAAPRLLCVICWGLTFSLGEIGLSPKAISLRGILAGGTPGCVGAGYYANVHDSVPPRSEHIAGSAR